MYRVLVVDDEPMVCNLIKHLLGTLKEISIVAEAYDGEEALCKAKIVNPDIIITDIRMPNIDGLTMLHQLHTDNPTVVVIILSAYGRFDYAKKALYEGAFEYLLKPIDENQLQSALRRAMHHIDKQNLQIRNAHNIKRELVKLQSEVVSKYQQEKGPILSIANSPIIHTAIKFIHENFSENITLSAVAEHVFLNRTYLSELFKAETGQNFNKYLTNLRIQKAKALLMVPSLRIREISQMVGFSSISYFIRIFKNILGSTPQEYRRKALHKILEEESQNETEVSGVDDPCSED